MFSFFLCVFVEALKYGGISHNNYVTPQRKTSYCSFAFMFPSEAIYRFTVKEALGIVS
jgi:hypothetical protein